ncbi:MAG: glycosyltransferase family 61 protein [Propionibacteriaceae bacterium]
MEWREQARKQVGRLRRQVRSQAAPSAPGPSAAETPASRPVRPEPTKGGFSVRYRSLLPTAGPRRVVILGGFEARDLVTKLLNDFAEDDVHVMSSYCLPEWELVARGVGHQPVEGPGQVALHLRLLGPIGILINCQAGDAKGHLKMWDKTHLHLKHGGVYAVSTSALDDESQAAIVQRWVDGQRAKPHIRDHVRSPRRDELDHAIQGVAIDNDWVMVLKGGHHYLKVREAEATRVLNARSGDGTARILARHAGGTLETDARVISHSAQVPIKNLETILAYPPSTVRSYLGPIGIGTRCLTFKDRALLPESFRHPFGENPRNAAAANIDSDFARMQRRLVPKEHLPGTYFHLDSSNSGHFGHVMTEVLSRLWGWDEAKAAVPDLKAIFRIRFPDERDPELEKRIFTAFGIPAEDIVWVDRPVWVDGLVGATPLWHNHAPFHANPRIIKTWDRIRSALLLPDLDVPEKILVTRPPNTKNRDCRNIGAVEELFAEYGFTILRPETLDLTEQATIFARAKVIAGFGGSGLFNLMYAQQAEKLIFLNQEAYTARNEHLYSLVLDCETHYFWSTPEIPHPEGRWTEEAYFSPWSFDFERNEAELRATLSDLG